MQGIFTVPGDGMISFKPIILKLHEIGYHEWMIVEAEQDPYKASPFMYARKSYKYLKDTINEVLKERQS